MISKNLALAVATVSALTMGQWAQAENSAAGMQLAAEGAVDQAQEAVSDTWITSKVKSSLLADSDVSGLDITVETNKGVVALSGVVTTDAERDKAVGIAKGIKGVKSVSADGLKSAD